MVDIIIGCLQELPFTELHRAAVPLRMESFRLPLYQLVTGYLLIHIVCGVMVRMVRYQGVGRQEVFFHLLPRPLIQSTGARPLWGDVLATLIHDL